MPGSKREDVRGPWPKGVNNRLPDRHVPADALRNAVNVELLSTGTVRRRGGYTSVAEGVYHSLWCENDVALGVKNDALIAIDTASLAETTLRAGLSSGNRMTYLWTPQGVYLSNGVITGRYVDGALAPWGVEHAHGQPTLTALSTGGLDAGRYQVAITYQFADGEEGGTTVAATVEVGSGGGIQAAAIPQPASSSVTHINVYVSRANGDVLYHHSTVAVGTTSRTITASTTLGRTLDTQFLYPMPAANVLELFNGRIYAAVGNVVWFSEPFRFGQRRPASFMLFPEPVTILSAVANVGLHVVSDRHYLLEGGGPEAFTMKTVLDNRGVRGTLVKLPNGIVRAWVTDKGLVTSPGDGTLELRLTQQIMIEEATEGSALYQERDGETFILASLRDGQSAAVAGDFVDAEVIRRS